MAASSQTTYLDIFLAPKATHFFLDQWQPSIRTHICVTMSQLNEISAVKLIIPTPWESWQEYITLLYLFPPLSFSQLQEPILIVTTLHSTCLTLALWLCLDRNYKINMMMISRQIFFVKHIVDWAYRHLTYAIPSVAPWWRHQMETFSALLAICAGNSPVTGEFPAQRPVTQSFDVFFDLRLNRRLSKQSWGWWFETPSCSLWRHCNADRRW